MVRILFFGAICIGLLVAALCLAGCAGTKPENLGARNGKLAPCPDRPNCVSSQATDPGQYIDPLACSGDPGETITEIDRVVSGMPGCKTIIKNDNYLHAQCSSRVFGFVDDLEFLVDSSNNMVHVRSAARVGYYDFKVNRNRLEQIRSQLSGKRD